MYENTASAESSSTKRKTTRRRTKKQEQEQETTDGVLYRDANGELVNLEEITASVQTEISQPIEDVPDLKFVEIKSVKRHTHDKNMSKHEHLQDNTTRRIIKPSVVQNKEDINSTPTRVVEHFDKDAFIAQHFNKKSCPCNDTVKNEKYYAFDKYGCIIRSDGFGKKNNPYCWTFDANNRPVSIFAEELSDSGNEITLQNIVDLLKQKFPTPFSARGVANKLYQRCYSASGSVKI